jgi:hypothetical protein
LSALGLKQLAGVLSCNLTCAYIPSHQRLWTPIGACACCSLEGAAVLHPTGHPQHWPSTDHPLVHAPFKFMLEATIFRWHVDRHEGLMMEFLLKTQDNIKGSSPPPLTHTRTAKLSNMYSCPATCRAASASSSALNVIFRASHLDQVPIEMLRRCLYQHAFIG